ncbi:hypothetical protein DFH09DRAFT_1135094 [Mycena vulgaris]|nr:hypothetical protein DFH09DRAFT_1135094 [Mycena vulgaris]
MGDITSDEDPDLLSQWTLFLEQYAKGQPQAPTPLLRASQVPGSSAASQPLLQVPLYPPGEISSATARTISQFYDQYGFLPPPRADEETVRLQTIQEYNLFRDDQIENFHRCSSLVNTFFHFAPVCTISLFHNDVHSVVSKAGEFPATPSTEMDEEDPYEAKIMRDHLNLNKSGGITELNELPGDWRFAGNPWSVDSTGVKGYVGVPITLEIDPSNPHDSERSAPQASTSPSAFVAVMSNRPLPKLTDSQRKVLDDLSAMLSIQLRSTWEGWRRGKEDAPAQQAIMHAAAAAHLRRACRAPESPAHPPRSAETLTAGPLRHQRRRRSKSCSRRTLAIIIDLTGFHATKMNDRRGRSHSWMFVGKEDEARARLAHRILGSSNSALYNDHEKEFNTPEAMADIATFLDMHVLVRAPPLITPLMSTTSCRLDRTLGLFGCRRVLRASSACSRARPPCLLPRLHPSRSAPQRARPSRTSHCRSTARTVLVY